MAVQVVDMSSFGAEVLNAKGLVVVEFYADWCRPCRILGPIYEDVAKQYEGRAKFLKVDTQVAGDLAAAQGVRSLPSILFYMEGRLCGALRRFVVRPALVNKLKELLEVA